MPVPCGRHLTPTLHALPQHSAPSLLSIGLSRMQSCMNLRKPNVLRTGMLMASMLLAVLKTAHLKTQQQLPALKRMQMESFATVARAAHV